MLQKQNLSPFEQDMKQLLKSFYGFFVSYGLEYGENGQHLDIEKFTSKLQGFQKDLTADSVVRAAVKPHQMETLIWFSLIENQKEPLLYQRRGSFFWPNLPKTSFNSNNKR